MVWAVFQFEVVKVSTVWSRERSLPAWPDAVTVTSPAGSEVSVTV